MTATVDGCGRVDTHHQIRDITRHKLFRARGVDPFDYVLVPHRSASFRILSGRGGVQRINPYANYYSTLLLFV